MSMHKIPLTVLEEEGLRKHGLDVGTPSQLSDCFRLGMAWQANHNNLVPPDVLKIELTFNGKTASSFINKEAIDFAHINLVTYSAKKAWDEVRNLK